MSGRAALCPGSLYPVIIFTTGGKQAKRTHAAPLVLFVWSGGAAALSKPPRAPKISREASSPKDVVELVEDELHRLVLVDHVYGHVAVVPLGAHQRGPEHDADVLGGHPVGV